MKFEPEYIDKLAKILTSNGLTEISMEDGEQALTIRKDLPDVVMTQTQAAAIPAQPATQVKEVSSSAKEEKEAELPAGKAVTSPMVGTFYSASSPDAAPFVEIGSDIQEGDIVCIIEAMKLMNEIKSEYSGKVTKICVKNGDPVEFGQVLMYVE